MSKHLSPFEVCERLVAPREELGPIVGLGPKASYGWRFESNWRDAGDFPSARIMRRLLAYSSARQLGLTEKHLIWGAPAAEIEEILAARRAGPAVAAE